jgi:hypothetical protein
MAGPEWAWASATTVVLLSLVGAPMLKMSLSEVTKNVSVTVPKPNLTQNQSTPFNNTPTDVQVGKGAMWNMSDAVAIKVKLDEPLLLRDSSYVEYTGRGWNVGNTQSPISGAFPVSKGPHGGIDTTQGLMMPIERPSSPRTITIGIKPALKTMYRPPISGTVTEITGPVKNAIVLQDGGLLLQPGVNANQSVTVYSLVPKSLEGDAPAMLAETMMYQSPSINRAPFVSDRVREFARSATAGETTDMGRANALARAIAAQCKYNLNARAVPPDKEAVDWFLFESKEGYCDLFATAMTVCARSIGMPARYSQGWMTEGREPGNDGFREIRERDYHAWCEIHFSGLGWVAFDATAGAAQIDPNAGGVNEPWYKQDWFKTALDIFMVVCAVAVALLIVLPRYGGKLWLRIASLFVRDRSVVRREEWARVHGRFQRLIERHARSPRRFSQTVREYVGVVSDRLGEATPLAYGLVGRFETAFYAPSPPEDAEIETMRQEVKKLAAALKLVRAQRA